MSEKYDVFISFKSTDAYGRATRDRQIAREIHDFMVARGIPTFYSERSLEEHGVSEFKKFIDKALDDARVLVVVGTSKENMESQFVRYEWDSFFNDIITGLKPGGRIFTYVDGVQLASLPRSLRQTQVIVHSSGSIERLHTSVAHALGKTVDPHESHVRVGIHLGIVESAIAFVNPKGPAQLICNAEGDVKTPSVIDFSQSPPAVGRLAWERLQRGAPDIAAFFIGRMGENFLWRLDKRDWTPTEMASLVLSKLKRDAEVVLELPITGAVVAIPAGREWVQTQCYFDAARLAGFEEIALIDEPTGAALAYSARQSLSDGIYLIYDLGSATFTASLVDIRGELINVLSTRADRCLGSVNWINCVANWLAEQGSAVSFLKNDDHMEMRVRMSQAAELAQKALYTRETVQVGFLGDGSDNTFTLTRSQFAQLTHDLLERTKRICEDVLEGASSWSKLSGVLLAGEATQMPIVHDYLRRLSGREPGPHIEEAIALGAAQCAATMFDRGPGMIASFGQEASELSGESVSPEGSALQVVDTLVVERGTESSKIEFCIGDLTSIQINDVVDVLVVSAFPNDYTPLPGSLIGALKRKGISVAQLAKEKDVDLRHSFSCWMSRELVDPPPGAHFKRILCFEPYFRGSPEALVGDVFRSLAPFLGGHPPLKSVAMPIVASGYQGVNSEKMLKLLIEAAVHWMEVGMPLSSLKIAILPGPTAQALQNTFQDLKRLFDTKRSVSTSTFRYHIFFSYARVDAVEVAIIERRLKELKDDIRLFIDRNELKPGAAWQQEIYESLDQCEKVVAVLTPAYLRSKVCLEEFNIALCRNREAERRILAPVYLYSSQLPTYMRLVQFWDCRECDRTKIDQACSSLLLELT